MTTRLPRRNECQPAPIRTLPWPSSCSRPWTRCRAAPRLSARTCQGADVRGLVHAGARGGEADARISREWPIDRRDGAVFEFDGNADDTGQRSGEVRPGGSRFVFTWGKHEHTDIVAHSTDGFPVKTGEEFLEFFHAAAEFGAGKPRRSEHSSLLTRIAKRFVETAKPIPTSFAREAYFAVTSFRFTNAEGVSRHGRFRIGPQQGQNTSPTQKRQRDRRTSCLTRSANGWTRGRSRSAYSCKWRSRAMTWPTPVCPGRTAARKSHSAPITLTARVDDQAPERRKHHFRSRSQGGRHRFIGRSAHGGAGGRLFAQRPQAAGRLWRRAAVIGQRDRLDGFRYDRVEPIEASPWVWARADWPCHTRGHGTWQAPASRRNSPPASRRSWPCVGAGYEAE